jgi:hypothetical protein
VVFFHPVLPWRRVFPQNRCKILFFQLKNLKTFQNVNEVSIAAKIKIKMKMALNFSSSSSSLSTAAFKFQHIGGAFSKSQRFPFKTTCSGKRRTCQCKATTSEGVTEDPSVEGASFSLRLYSLSVTYLLIIGTLFNLVENQEVFVCIRREYKISWIQF